MFWQEEKITPGGAHLQYCGGDVEQEEDDEDAGSGTAISKGTSSRLGESMPWKGTCALAGAGAVT